MKCFEYDTWSFPNPFRAKIVRINNPRKTGIIVSEIKPVLGKTPPWLKVTFRLDLWPML
jgi:hypothetical protein